VPKTELPAKSSPPAKPELSGPILRDPSELKPWPNNPRRHNELQLTKLAASMREYGFTSPVIVDEKSTILSGHARVDVACRLHLTQIPTVVMSGLTKSQKRAYVLADNKLALLSTWDAKLLQSEIELLIQDDFEIELTGFSTPEIDVMLYQEAGDPDDLLPDVDEQEVVTRKGDLWKLGVHRLLCGSALDTAAYEQLMQGQRAQMTITDPPYNVKIDGHVCGNGKVKHAEFAMASGEMSPAQFEAFLRSTCTLIAKFSQDGAICYVFMDWRHSGEIQNAAHPVWGPARQVCVWAKDNAGMGTFYRSQHEFVFVFKNGDAPHINNFELGQHGRHRSNVWQYPGVNSGNGHKLLALHPTVKPVSLVADAIRDCSHRKGLILDPFAGSGTILLAAERTQRHARAIELEPRYVDVAIQRWQRHTGQQAVLEATGQTWDEVREERLDADDEQGEVL
jgi:DNA modification methylase